MSTPQSSYVYPVVYLGPKDSKTFHPAGPVRKQVHFTLGEEAEAFGGKPYAYVTEVEARYMISRSMGPHGPLFAFADGRAPVNDNVTLTARVSVLEEKLDQLLALFADGAPSDTDEAAEDAPKKGKAK
mgnify:CR=1 FL=1|jgi:hypothetical protein|nr:MAG TPA: hypothetical protein [Caudoviricetes sp.]